MTRHRLITNSTYFNIASSTNLTSWTHVASVNSGIANTRFTWAPESYVEGGTVRVIASVAATTCSNCFRPYVYTAQNTALTSWSGPSQMWGLGTNHIDTFVVKSGSTWHAFTKDETGKYIEHWTTTANLYEGWVNRGRLLGRSAAPAAATALPSPCSARPLGARLASVRLAPKRSRPEERCELPRRPSWSRPSLPRPHPSRCTTRPTRTTHRGRATRAPRPLRTELFHHSQPTKCRAPLRPAVELNASTRSTRQLPAPATPAQRAKAEREQHDPNPRCPGG